MNAYERETTINASDGDPLVRIWTAQRTVITALRKKPQFTEITSGTDPDGTAYAEFTIPADQFVLANAAKRKVTMSDERRQELSNRMRALREQQLGTNEGEGAA